jgi:hypothetical protein
MLDFCRRAPVLSRSVRETPAFVSVHIGRLTLGLSALRSPQGEIAPL